MHRFLCLSGAVLAATIGQAMARESNAYTGHFPAPSDERRLQQTTAQTGMAMSPTDIASLNCDALKDGKSDDEWRLQQIAAQTRMAMSPTDIASLNCEALKGGKAE